VRLLLVLFSSVLCAGLSLAGALPSVESARPPAAAGTSPLQRAFAHDAQLTRKLLDQTCERDLQLERLLIEVQAGAPDTDESRQARQLGKLMGGQVRMYLERAGGLQPLSSASQQPLPSLELLQLARRARGALPGDPPELLDSCVAVRGALRLWVVRSIEVEQLLRNGWLEPAAYELVTVASTAAPIDGQELQLPSLMGGPGLRIRERKQGHADERLFGYLLALAAGGALLGAGLGFWLTRARPVDDAVLSAIETATARVAQGDLSSQISLSVSGRADQTLRSFDRMTHELRETRAKLREAERAAAWQDMAQRIAHEIKNPLSPIKLALETLRKAHDKRLADFDEIFEESTRAMLEEVARMEHIVREFSDFARLPRARPGALDLARLVQETAGLYAPEGVELSLEAPSDPLLAHADREQLVQVVVNLLANAGDAARSHAAPRVAVGLRRDEGHVLLWIDDNGPGVAPAERERIFEPYVTNKAHGTGLGLAIVRRIVQDHGGSITVGDSPLGGARFNVRLLPSVTGLGVQPSASMP